MNLISATLPKSRAIAWLFIVLVAISACSPAQITPAPSPLPQATLAAASPTVSPSPPSTTTPLPTMTATQTPLPSASPTPEPSPTPAADFGKAKILGVTVNQVGGIQVSVSVPSLSGSYNLILGGAKFTCEVNAKKSDQLDCWGLSEPPVNVTMTIAFLNPSDGSVVYEGKTYLPEGPALGNKTYTGTNCASAGQNESCEVECRVDPNTNQPCIVASCFDACGQTFSIQTCNQSVPLKEFSMCDGATMAQMKARYHLP